MTYGMANGIGGFDFSPEYDGLRMGSLPAVNPASAAGLLLGDGGIVDGFTWSDYLAAKDYFDGLTVSGTNFDGACIYIEEPLPTIAPTALPFPAPTPKPTRKKQTGGGGGAGRDDTRTPTAQPTEVQTVVEIESELVLDGVSADAINDDEDMQLAIGNTILATVPEFTRVHSIVAFAARRRRLQSGARAARESTFGLGARRGGVAPPRRARVKETRAEAPALNLLVRDRHHGVVRGRGPHRGHGQRPGAHGPAAGGRAGRPHDVRVGRHVHHDAPDGGRGGVGRRRRQCENQPLR